MKQLPTVSGTRAGVGGLMQVDVIIAAWSASSTIKRAIDSALDQPEVAKVIVVDDASADDTLAVAHSCDRSDGRLVVLAAERNRGPASARNLAIAESCSPWISLLDADDYFLPGRIREMLALTGDVDILADDLLVLDQASEGRPARLMFGLKQEEQRSISFKEFVLGNAEQGSTGRSQLGFVKPLIKRAFIERNGLRYDISLRLGEDYDLYARALALGGIFRLIAAKGYVYVIRSDSISGNHTEEDLHNLREADARLFRLTCLSEEDRDALRRHYVSVNCRLQWRKLIRSVKSRSLREALATFKESPRVSMYLAARLIEQAAVRASRLFTLSR